MSVLSSAAAKAVEEESSAEGLDFLTGASSLMILTGKCCC
jgi:hypothetical protein